jgi:NAD(P)-dependent dehydrogenase (short-subunit alcohol dehydrogenase family)
MNRIAVVTGASTGIGKSIAIELAKTGIYVYLIARTKNRLDDTLNIIENSGGHGKVIIADLSKIESVNSCIQNILSDTKSINILVNVAGIWHGENEVYAKRNFETFSQEIILDTFFVGTVAPTLLIHAFIPFMPQESSMINISGTFEYGAKGWLPYFVSKRALEDLTVGLSQELTDKKIFVNAVSPSDTKTEAYLKYFPEYKDDAVSPGEIAKQIMYLVSDEAKFITGKVFVVKKGKEITDGYHQ